MKAHEQLPVERRGRAIARPETSVSRVNRAALCSSEREDPHPELGRGPVGSQKASPLITSDWLRLPTAHHV